jgi:hypothetical protein
MANLIPPQPTGSLPGEGAWNDWIEKIRSLVNNLIQGFVNHNDLQNIQGGLASERYHLDNTDYTALSGTRTNKGVDTTDDVIVDDATNGLVLKDTQGTPHYWRVTVNNTGTLVITDLGTTKP